MQKFCQKEIESPIQVTVLIISGYTEMLIS